MIDTETESMAGKSPAPRNRTLRLTENELLHYRKRLVQLSEPAALSEILNRTIHQDLFEAVDYLPDQFVDLLFIDPPYNLTKHFNQQVVRRRSPEEYAT